MGKVQLVKKYRIEKDVLDMFAQGMSAPQIARRIDEMKGIKMSPDAITNFLNQKQVGKIGKLDPEVKEARALWVEASASYTEFRKKLMAFLSGKEKPDPKQMAVLANEVRAWWDRLARVAGLLGPDVNFVQQNFVQQTFVGDAPKTIADMLCPVCKEKFMQLREDDNADDVIDVEPKQPEPASA